MHLAFQPLEDSTVDPELKSDYQLQQILEFAPQLICVTGPAGEHLYMNQVALTYFGMTLEEWRQTRLGDRLHPEDRERVLEAKAAREANGAAYKLEVRLRRHDGVYRWFSARFYPVRDDRNNVSRWYLAWTDIDDRKRAKAARSLSERIAAHEKTAIEDALRASTGRVFGPAGAAARLGIPRSTLESKIRALGINKNRFRR